MSHERKGTYRAKTWSVKQLGPPRVRPFRLTSTVEQVNGQNAISTMNASALAAFSLCLATTLLGEDPGGPVITVRKGTSQQVAIKEIGGPAGGAATGVLKNDIQLSGALSLGDAATATITVAGRLRRVLSMAWRPRNRVAWFCKKVTQERPVTPFINLPMT